MQKCKDGIFHYIFYFDLESKILNENPAINVGDATGTFLLNTFFLQISFIINQLFIFNLFHQYFLLL